MSGSTLTIVSAGTTTITAAQGGDANYLAATPVGQVQTIDPPTKQPQTITFAALGGTRYTMPVSEFLSYWTGIAVHKIVP